MKREVLCPPERNYVVRRTTELADFIKRVKQGRYIVIFAPRQTGKTTFFRWALDALAAEGITYFPIQLNFEAYKNLNASVFYGELYWDIREQIGKIFQKRGHMPSESTSSISSRGPGNRSSVNATLLYGT